jgi:citrate synthase
VRDLAADAEFEEVAYLLLYGELPTKAELADYKRKLKGLRDLPQALKEVLERIPRDAHPMDVMRTGCSVLGTLEPELTFDAQRDKTDRLLALFPAMMCYWYRFSHNGKRIDCKPTTTPIGGHFLHLLHGRSRALHVKVMNVSLILYAEHEFNASTFTARVCASTGPTCIPASPRPSARCAARCTAAPTSGDGRSSASRPEEAPAEGTARAQGQDHGLRPRHLQRVRPAQRGDQGLVEAAG